MRHEPIVNKVTSHTLIKHASSHAQSLEVPLQALDVSSLHTVHGLICVHGSRSQVAVYDAGGGGRTAHVNDEDAIGGCRRRRVYQR
eukprot:scaffold139825_cov33-Tisochrysis_lutea.AAC.2